MGKIIGDRDILEPIEGGDAELGSSDVCEGIDLVDPVNGSLDGVVDGSDVALDGCSEIAKSSLEEVADLRR